MKRQALIKKINLKNATCHLSAKKKPLNILRSKEAYGLKISQSIVYIKKYFYVFYSTLKDIIQAQSKTNH